MWGGKVTEQITNRLLSDTNIAVFGPLFQVDFGKRPSGGRNSHWYSLLIISLNLSGFSKMGSFLIIVVKLHSYKDSDVRNLRKFEYFYDYFRHSRNT